LKEVRNKGGAEKKENDGAERKKEENGKMSIIRAAL